VSAATISQENGGATQLRIGAGSSAACWSDVLTAVPVAIHQALDGYLHDERA
jgi:hypothetical protein